ncbi:ROK family transcriptional regulator [Pseudactinotalea suaedae]|uniref:ROK family transcriptional regulator n=1 Tax=Pseudactinotalea suaedae TaxID=1524924 RepID=UPI0012E11D80|nr:ROK family transcriptional regulator [Pseudactinotalea suaedae]
MATTKASVHGQDHVQSAVLGLLGTRGPMSRADLARTLQISPARLTAVAKELLERGMVTELDTTPSTGGRPGRLLGLTSANSCAIGAKVTADHVTTVIVNLDGTVAASDSHPFDATSATAQTDLAAILAATVEVADAVVLGIGVGIPGAVDSQASGVVTAPFIGWGEAAVGATLRAALNLPVLVENDVDALTATELLFGPVADHADALVVTIGRGIGAGVVVDGAVHRGSHGAAGEIGHIPIDPDGMPCSCGSVGCLETIVGDAALIRAARAVGLLADDTVATTDDLLALADAGDPAAQEVYAHAGRVLARALAGVVHTIDPEIVVLHGEGVIAWHHWKVGFEPAFRRSLMASRRGVPFHVMPWSDVAWAQGAASLVLGSPFDVAGATGDQGRLVRERLSDTSAGREPRSA